MTSLPGADSSGLIVLLVLDGPLLLNEAILSEESVAPTAITFWSPGLSAVPQFGPELPAAKTGMIFAAFQAAMALLYHPSP